MSRGLALHRRRRFSAWAKFGIPAVGLLLLWLLYYEMPIIFSSLIIALGLLYVLNPAVDYMESRSIRRAWACVVVLLGMVLVVYLMWLRLMAFSSGIGKFDPDLFQKNLVKSIYDIVLKVEEKAPILKRYTRPETRSVQAVPENAAAVAAPTAKAGRRGHRTAVTPVAPALEPAGAAPLGLEERINNFVEDELVDRIPLLAKKLAGMIPNLILIPYFTFFLLKDGREFKKTIIEYIPNEYFEPSLKFFYELNRRLRSYLHSLLLDCTLVGVLVGTGVAVVGAPFPVLMGIIAFFLNSIPLVGPLVYGTIGLLLTLGSGQPLQVIVGFLGVFLLSRLCDDLIFVPTIYGKSHHIHPVAVVCAVLIGETVAGVWGMFLAIPIASVLMLGIGIIREISVGEDPAPLPPSAFVPFA